VFLQRIVREAMNSAEHAQAFERAMAQGLEAYQAERVEEALTAFREAVRLRPEDGEAASLLGLALSISAWSDQALGFLRYAVQQEPEQLPFRMNLVEGLERLGQIEQAQQEARAVIVRDVGHVRAWEKSGDLAAAAGDAEAAEAAWTQARALAPEAPTPAIKLARLAATRGDPQRAHAILDQVADRWPDNRHALNTRAQVLAAERNWPRYAAVVDQWLKTSPQDPDAWRAASRLHFETGRHRDAANAFGRVLTLTAPNAADLTAFASLSLHALDTSAAAAALEQAEKLDPEYCELLATRALLEMYLGRFAAAADDCLRCLARDPGNVSAATTLSRLQRGRLGERELSMMRVLSTDLRAHLDRRIPAAFAVAHALDERGDTDQAFVAYGAAHALAQQRDRIEGRRFDRHSLDERRSRLGRVQWPTDPQPARPPRPARPIFIVGMPRSGTTLIEAVIAAHPRVFGCGERIAMPPLIDALLDLAARDAPIEPHWLFDAARSYLAGLPSIGAADHFTDKQPFNFEAVGLIDRLFPDAAIVHVRRNPLETCLSIYRQEFHKAWSFAHELADIAAVYAHHARLMQDWQARLPGRVRTIQYEDFVADFDTQAHALIAHCGLEWHPACADFQKSERPIATFSTVEARDPVASRNGRAARYRAQLQPLADELQGLGIDLTTGASVG
jgi:tetratricopeptide (TPR) repeat protein